MLRSDQLGYSCRAGRCSQYVVGIRGSAGAKGKSHVVQVVIVVWHESDGGSDSVWRMAAYLIALRIGP